jgi:hypothetical protein
MIKDIITVIADLNVSIWEQNLIKNPQYRVYRNV